MEEAGRGIWAWASTHSRAEPLVVHSPADEKVMLGEGAMLVSGKAVQDCAGVTGHTQCIVVCCGITVQNTMHGYTQSPGEAGSRMSHAMVCRTPLTATRSHVTCRDVQAAPTCSLTAGFEPAPFPDQGIALPLGYAAWQPPTPRSCAIWFC